MRYTNIPGTDLTTSTIGFGTALIGSAINRETSLTLLDTYLELGGNLIDTASVYADWLPVEKSVSEVTIGRWLQLRGNRDRVVLATKGGHPDLSTMYISRLSRQEIVDDLHASLGNLDVEVIDLYWLHRDDLSRPVGDILETLNNQVKAGKIRYFGCSNWRPSRIRMAQEYAAQHDLRPFVADQMMWSLAVVDMNAIGDRTMVAMDDKLWAYHRETGMAAIPYSSQAKGLFQKMADRGARAPRSGALRMYDLPQNDVRLHRIKQLAAENGLSITEIVLGYLQSQPFTTIPIVGCRTVKQLRDSLRAGDVRLRAEDVAFLEAM